MRQDSFDQAPFDWEPQEFSVDGGETPPKVSLESRESQLEQERKDLKSVFDSDTKTETPEVKRLKTKSGRTIVPRTVFAPEAATYNKQKQAQKSTLLKEQADWDARKARDHAVRDEKEKPPTHEPVEPASAPPPGPAEAPAEKDFDEAA